MSQSIQSYVSSEAKTSALEIIRAEESLPASLTHLVEPKQTEDPQIKLLKCICKKHDESSNVKISPTHVEEILKAKEIELREEYEKILQREKQLIKERYNLILLNEQTRASYMLREAHRERQEKIHALQTQLQCKNLAALMYVMCTERKRSRFEKLLIIEDYTNYINVLHDILTKGQELILHLSRGYKTAARVDHEWREKMKKVVNQFLAFIYHFAGGDPETNQYLIDLPKLLKTDAPLDINPNEDPCDCDDDEDEPLEDIPRTGNKEWWEDLDAEHSPFVMFGDMADFQPNQRRETLKSLKAQKIKAEKTAPKEWKELAFNDMFLKSNCVHLDKIKTMYQDRLPTPIKWECLHSPGNCGSKMSIPASHRGASLDIRGTMGSILKIITLGPTTGPVPAKTELLGARDSIEIASMTKVRMSLKSDMPVHHYPEENVVLDIGKKRASLFADNEEDDSTVELQFQKLASTSGSVYLDLSRNTDSLQPYTILKTIQSDGKHVVLMQMHDLAAEASTRKKVYRTPGRPTSFVQDSGPSWETWSWPRSARGSCSKKQPKSPSKYSASGNNDNINIVSDELSVLGSLHTDSLQVVHNRHPEQDHMINYERVCPMGKCQRLQVDSFMRSLPPYMRANPFTHFEQTFEEYETCTPEQLEILKQRIENKMNKESKKDLDNESGLESPLSEWYSTGVAVQTSEVNVQLPCSCHDERPSPDPKDFVFDLANLELVKLAMDAIHKECLFSDKIDFDRFKLLGRDLDCMQQKQEQAQKQNGAEFRESRYQEISEILNKHPSLLDIFQANAK